MTRISARSAIWYKRVFPLVWLGALGFVVVSALSADVVRRDPMFIVMPCVMAAFGFLLMKRLVWDLADAVFDDGDALLVRKGATEVRVPFSNIMNVSATLLTNPRRITLRLVTAGALGEEIAFMPVTTFSLNPFRRNALADDLIVRAYRARTRS